MKKMMVTPKLSVLAGHIKTLEILTSHEFIFITSNMIFTSNMTDVSCYPKM